MIWHEVANSNLENPSGSSQISQKLFGWPSLGESISLPSKIKITVSLFNYQIVSRTIHIGEKGITMATEIMEVVDVAVDDDDEVTVLYSTPDSSTRGTTKTDAISVEDYKPKRFIDLSLYSYFDDDEVKVLSSSPIITKEVFKGECSTSKSSPSTESGRIPLESVCEICADQKPRSAMFRIWGCPHYYCTNCIKNYVATKLQENITKIGCPVPSCKGCLEPYHCRPILPKEVFDRWGDALCESVILGSEKFYCPFKDCSALLIDDRNGKNEVIAQSECPYCHRLFCGLCKVPWHFGVMCVEFQKLKNDERSNEDLQLMKLAKDEKWQRCSKCGFYVEKIVGCMVIKCRCGYYFCYYCGTGPLKEHYCRHCNRSM